MNKLAIFIKTMNKETIFLHCLNSLIHYMKNHKIDYKIYIADDGYISDVKKMKYEELRKRGHNIVTFNNKVSASFARNALFGLLNTEEYILRMDDDFELTYETDIHSMLKIFAADLKIGIVADLERQIGIGKGVFDRQINKWQGFIEFKNNKLFKKLSPLNSFNYKYISNIPYAECDITRNMLLIKRQVLENVKWDDSIYFAGEHEDFLIRVKRAGWKIVFTTVSIHNHNDKINLQTLDELKKKRENWESFKKKWSIEKIVIKRPFIHKIQAGLVKYIRILLIFIRSSFTYS